jgi:RecB family exonuclease
VSAARDIRLARVPHLRAAHRALASLTSGGDPLQACDRMVLVSTRQGARELRRTLERLLLADDQAGAVWVPPRLLTRRDFYVDLHARLGQAAPRWLSRAEREAAVWHASDTAIAEGLAPPFQIRPGLLSGMLSLYDGLRRNLRAVDDFERVLTGVLEPGADTDRGAARLLIQTRYLVRVYRKYESLLDDAGVLDEHRLREAVTASGLRAPVAHVIVTVADQAAEPDGLWPADFDLLTRLAGLRRIDVVATETVLDAGFRLRLFDLLPGIEEQPWIDQEEPPALVVPGASDRLPYFLSRDREQELVSIAASVQALEAEEPPTPDAGATPPGVSARAPAIGLEDVLVVYDRPLPYVYLARRVFDAAGVPVTVADALPLAAEPYAAAVDLVLDAALSSLAREPLLRLLGSRVLTWREDGRGLSLKDVGVLRAHLQRCGVRGGRAELEAAALELPSGSDPPGPAGVRLKRAIAAASALADDLVVFEGEHSLAALLTALGVVLRRRERRDLNALGERHARARSATLAGLDELAAAYAGADGRRATVRELVPLVRRAIEAHTFSPEEGNRGVRLADARSARYADAARVWLIGLIEGEWPVPARRSALYPAGLLRDLGFAREQDRVPFARAAFQDLLALARARVSVSVFQLEEDAIVRPSVLLEDLPELPFIRVPLTSAPARNSPARPTADSRWLAHRQRPRRPDDPRFHGAVGPLPARTHSVTQVERYLECPFKYFAASVLHLEEEEARDAVGLDPRRRGTLVHQVFQTFFAAWQAEGRGTITPAGLPAARARFAEIVEEALAHLSQADRAVERTRLLGSSAAPGVGERVFRLEALRPVPVLDRWLEVDLHGTWGFGRDRARRVSLKGVADRIDLLADGTFRLIDYKSGKAPHPRQAIQLPVYAACAEQKLEGVRGRSWRVGEAAYVALSDRRPWVAVVRHPDDRGHLEEGENRFLTALDGIAGGAFPPAPVSRRLCTTCAFATVCRKDYVGEIA